MSSAEEKIRIVLEGLRGEESSALIAMNRVSLHHRLKKSHNGP
jgi:hypothetical protein